MERQRQYFSVLKQIKPVDLANSRLIVQRQTRQTAIPLSMGKSLKNIKDMQKIISIKHKCLQDAGKQSEIISTGKK
jgi:hypothetical protein